MCRPGSTAPNRLRARGWIPAWPSRLLPALGRITVLPRIDKRAILLAVRQVCPRNALRRWIRPPLLRLELLPSNRRIPVEEGLVASGPTEMAPRYNMRAFPLMLVVTFLSTCAAHEPTRISRPDEPRSLADSVTITRDEYGVPHVYGETDASVVFGYLYAQAEDHFSEIEDNYAAAIGRAAELRGERALAGDVWNSLFEIPALSKAEYQSASPTMRSLYDASAGALNFYLSNHQE